MSNDATRPLAIIFDRDGTLASIFNGPTKDDRSKMAWAAFNAALRFDAIVPEVAALLRSIRPGVIRIMASGRAEGDHLGDRRRRFALEDWLYKYNLPIDKLFMREGGDHRLDSVVKEEMLIRDILPYYNVVMAVEDREEVALVWERYNIGVIRVKNPGKLPPIALQTP